MPIDSKQGDGAQKSIECAAGTGQLCITTGNHTRRDRRKDGSSTYLWLAAFLDGIVGENGSFRDGTPDPSGGIRQGIVFKSGIITRRKIS